MGEVTTIGLDLAKMVCSQRTNSLMFVVNAFRHDGAASAELRR
jgi:hypothetical protein